jgi:hypothetical protein
MADIRITGGSAPPVPAQRSDAVRSAQRAFFQAAVGGVQAPRPADTAPAAAVRAAPAPSALAAAAPEPGRYLRPGSLLDIKV